MAERCFQISKNIFVTVNDVHRFGTDAVLLADFAAPKSRDVACDMGTGCGIIPFVWCAKPAPKKITAIEIQEDACDLVRKSAKLSGVEDRVNVICGNLREVTTTAGHGQFTLVTMNPPYKQIGGGIISESDGEKLTRHETACTLDDAAAAAARLLNFGGRFCLCHRPERLTDILCSLRSAGLEPKRMRFVVQRDGKAPWLVLVEGKKGARPGIITLPQLVMEDENGQPTKEIDEIYADYREMRK